MAAFAYYRGNLGTFGAFHEVAMVLIPAVVMAVLYLLDSEAVTTAVVLFFLMTVSPLLVVNEILSPFGTSLYVVAKSGVYSVFMKAAYGMAVGTLLVLWGRGEGSRGRAALVGLVLLSVGYDIAASFLFPRWNGVTPGLPLTSVALVLNLIFSLSVKSPKKGLEAAILFLAVVVVAADFVRAIPEANENWAQFRFFLDASAVLVLAGSRRKRVTEKGVAPRAGI